MNFETGSMGCRVVVLAAALGLSLASAVDATPYPGNPPGRAEARIEGDRLVFENATAGMMTSEIRQAGRRLVRGQSK